MFTHFEAEVLLGIIGEYLADDSHFVNAPNSVLENVYKKLVEIMEVD